MKSVARKLRTEKLTVRETLLLLKQQERLSVQLRQVAAARLEKELAEGKAEAQIPHANIS